MSSNTTGAERSPPSRYRCSRAPRCTRLSSPNRWATASSPRSDHSSMNDLDLARTPAALDAILNDTDALGFTMASEPKVGALLAAVAASKPGGRFLELGTGTGHGTAWLLSGMDSKSRLQTVDSDPNVVAIARRHLGDDRRVTFHVMDGAEFLQQAPRAEFDFIYADAWPGKFS